MYLEKESKVHIVRYITERYGDILGYSLNNHHLNKILTDPLFKGRPEHHGHTVPDESLRLSWHKDLYCLLKQYKDEHGKLPSNHDALKQIQQLVEKRKDETVFTKAELKSKTVAVRYMDHGEEKTIGRSAFDQMMTKLRKLF